MNITTIGIDVSKQKIDICIYCSKETFTLTNDLSGFKQLLKKIRKMQLDVSRIVIEHTGGYQRDLVKFLINNDLPVCVVNPASVRHFAKAAGYLAKTDKIDAFVLALYGEKLQPKLTALKNEHLLVLRDLVNQRKQLSDWNKQTKQWLEKQPGKQWQKRIKSQQMWLEKQLKRARKEIRDFIKAHEDLCSRYNALLSVRGVGEDTAAFLLAELSELGDITRQKIVALCGLAPINRDSGMKRGKAFIQGGRKKVRNYLYLCVISCLRSDGVIRAYYDHLKAMGKPSKVAITACMRKLLIHLNTKLSYVK